MKMRTERIERIYGKSLLEYMILGSALTGVAGLALVVASFALPSEAQGLVSGVGGVATVGGLLVLVTAFILWGWLEA